MRGKRGIGYCKSMAGAVLPFRRMQARNDPEPTDLLFLSYQVRQFTRILTTLVSSTTNWICRTDLSGFANENLDTMHCVVRKSR